MSEPRTEANFRYREAEAAAEAWNDAHAVGTPVRYWTGLREGDGAVSVTRWPASVLGGHTAVVWVEHEGACIALTHVDPIGVAHAI